MKNILLKKTGVYSLISLFLLSSNLYAQCFDYVGLKQRAGYQVVSESSNDDITDTGIGAVSGRTETLNYDRESSDGTGSIVYDLEYCDISGFVVGLNAAYFAGSGDFTDSGTEINKFSREYEASGLGINLFIGYEW